MAELRPPSRVTHAARARSAGFLVKGMLNKTSGPELAMTEADREVPSRPTCAEDEGPVHGRNGSDAEKLIALSRGRDHSDQWLGRPRQPSRISTNSKLVETLAGRLPLRLRSGEDEVLRRDGDFVISGARGLAGGPHPETDGKPGAPRARKWLRNELDAAWGQRAAGAGEEPGDAACCSGPGRRAACATSGTHEDGHRSCALPSAWPPRLGAASTSAA